MAEGFSIELVEDNSPMVIAATEEAIQAALEAVGIEVEARAKQYEDRVDTGRLRNSITHEVRGDTVYVGTNVEYAPYIELGTYRMRAANGGKGYLRPAVTEHVPEYKRIVETYLKNIT